MRSVILSPCPAAGSCPPCSPSGPAGAHKRDSPMNFLDFPGCDRIAWDGPTLYAVNNAGWCSQLLPQQATVFAGRSRPTFRHDLLEAKGDLILVGRDVLAEVAGLLTIGLIPDEPSGWYVRRRCNVGFSRREITVLEDREPGAALLDLGTTVSYYRRFDHAVLGSDERVLLANRLEAMLFDLNSPSQQASPFVFDSGTGQRRPAGAHDREVIQALADPNGGFLALLQGGTLARLTIEDGTCVLRLTTVIRNDWHVWWCHVSESSVLFFHEGGQASLVDRVTNSEIGRLQIGTQTPALHPDGNTIAIANGNRVLIGKCNSFESHQRLVVMDGDVNQVAFAPDGLTIAAATENGVTVFDIR
jgi:hypothetical protein